MAQREEGSATGADSLIADNKHDESNLGIAERDRQGGGDGFAVQNGGATSSSLQYMEVEQLPTERVIELEVATEEQQGTEEAIDMSQRSQSGHLSNQTLQEVQNTSIEYYKLPVPPQNSGHQEETESKETPTTSMIIAMDSSSVVTNSSLPSDYQLSLSQSTESPGYCLVCSDKGSGYHYSAFSCEGCKGFFKRTIQKNLVYQCKDAGLCVINKFTRNSCQYCRFQRCMEVGMKREAVREDRSPGGKHRVRRRKLDYSYENMCLPAAEEYMDEVIEMLVEAKPDLLPEPEPSLDVDIKGSSESNLDINQLMRYGYGELKMIIQWSKKVPGFTSLCIDDQMAMLKSAFMELNVFRLAYRSREYEGAVRFADNILLSKEESADIGWGQELILATLDFIRRLKDLYIDRVEFCILNGLILTYPDATGLKEKEKVQVLQAKILDSFRKYETSKYPHNPRRYGKVLLRLPALRTVSAKAAERFLSMSLEGTVKLSALVTEMLHI